MNQDCVGDELGFTSTHVNDLIGVLEEPALLTVIQEPTDLVLFFPTYETTSTFGCKKGLESESIQLLWAIVNKVRPCLELDADIKIEALCICSIRFR